MKRRTQQVHVAGRTTLATVTADPAVARRWVHTARWRKVGHLRSRAGLIVGMGVQWTPSFRRLSDGAEARPAAGHAAALLRAPVPRVPDRARRRRPRPSGAPAVPGGRARGFRRLQRLVGLQQAERPLRPEGGVPSGAAQGDRHGERIHGEHGGAGPRVARGEEGRADGRRQLDVITLSKKQVRYAATDAFVSYCLGVKCLK
ncbi:hypothetical protein ACQJBY_003221 [Aegilops geniculata]